mmetsp:Transcript_1549/g.4934  ORF Transcript_1549/g.4934 Transcript_1549/m.4934 type:complete len:202 (+) Transcript_1549:1142-1747(+)
MAPRSLAIHRTHARAGFLTTSASATSACTTWPTVSGTSWKMVRICLRPRVPTGSPTMRLSTSPYLRSTWAASPTLQASAPGTNRPNATRPGVSLATTRAFSTCASPTRVPKAAIPSAHSTLPPHASPASAIDVAPSSSTRSPRLVSTHSTFSWTPRSVASRLSCLTRRTWSSILPSRLVTAHFASLLPLTATTLFVTLKRH